MGTSDDPILEPKPTKCIPMPSDDTAQPPPPTVSCCYHPTLRKWYPYDTINGWDLTQECHADDTGGDSPNP
jgi:hypothetical protein